MLRAISLFSGAGGMDIGFQRAGFDTRLAVEIDPSCCDTLRHNMPNTVVVKADIAELSGQEICNLAGLNVGDVDCVYGGPPCQSFSLAGNRLGLGDARGQMVGHFVRLVREIAPKSFVMENVKGMLNWNSGEVLRFLEDSFSEPLEHPIGLVQYSVSHALLNAVDFGAPQRRERIFVVGNRLRKEMQFPQPSHGNVETLDKKLGLRPFTTVGDTLSELPKADAPSDTALRVSGTISDRRIRHGY